MNGSETWFERAKKKIPGGVSSPVRSFKHVGRAPIYFDRGEGPYLFDIDGKRYTDFCMSFGPHLLGHSPEVVRQALHAQVDKAVSFGACHPLEVELAEGILGAYPFLDQVRLVNSGTEAVMTAVRLARGATQRPKVIQFDGCYHGHSDGLLARAGSGVATLSESTSKGVPSSIVQETLVARLDDLTGFERLLQEKGSQIAAVIVEPIPANNGLWIPTGSHLEKILSLAHSVGALVIFDEVISGFRLGFSGASGLYDLQPDLVTLGKVLGGGLPVAAVAGKHSVMGDLAPLGDVYQAGTLSGNPLGAAAGCAVLQSLRETPPYEMLAQRTADFASRLQTSLARAEVTVVSIGSVFWIHFGPLDNSFPPPLSADSRNRYAAFFRRALELGIYLPPSPYEVGFISTAHSPAVLEEALDRLSQCVD